MKVHVIANALNNIGVGLVLAPLIALFVEDQDHWGLAIPVAMGIVSILLAAWLTPHRGDPTKGELQCSV